MKFCDMCGSYMEMADEGYSCPRCGYTIQADEIEVKIMRDSQAEAIHVIDKRGDDLLRVNRTCPSCGHHEAYRHVSMTSGEHAGVKQERIVERYKCTKCSNSWTKS